MESFLGAGQSNPPCSSVADLQDQLRDLLGSRVTETRAEHVSVTFAIRATTVFEIPVSETENEALENASNIDPLLGGAQSSTAPAANGNANENGAPASRKITAIDALINQPSDDPVLQRSIIKHIITALAEVDMSSWIVRQVSRNEQGWTFTYICKDSCQAWNRQASKTPAKTAIGEWSEKSPQDPIHFARPAFDCRGSVKIAFVRSTKTIDVKYEHTPIHKTVGQLIELLAPPPIAPLVKTPAKKVKEPKPPKEPRPPKAPRPPKEPKPRTPRVPKKRSVENDDPDGEGSQPSKRRKKKTSTALGGSVLPPEMPGVLPVGDPSTRQLYNTDAGDHGIGQPSGSSSYPEALVSATNAHDASTSIDDVHSHSILNLPPGEASRRRDVAIKLLTSGSIDPKTLSAEQFSIFANQSPELQQDSLTMLVKYGAERLRIVHPPKSGSSSGQATPDKPGTPAPAGGQPPTPRTKKPRRKKKSDAETAVAGVSERPEAAGRKPRRRVCDNCRINKYKGKCDKALPSCSMCVAEGAACVYAPSRPRQSNAVEAAPEAAPEVPEPVPEAPESVPEVPEPADTEMANDEPDDLGSPGFHTAPHSPPEQPVHDHLPGHGNAQVPDPAPRQLNPPSDAFNSAHGSYQHPSGLTFPQVATTAGPEPSQPRIPSGLMETSPMDYTPTSLSETPVATLNHYTYPQPPTAHGAASEYTYSEQPTAAVVPNHRRNSGATQAASRRSLPSGQSSLGSGTTDTTVHAQTSAWQQSIPNTSSAAAAPTWSSPGQSRSKNPAPISHAYDDLPQQSSGWGTASQPGSQTTQPVHTSPALAAAQPARARSRQSGRARSNTPVNGMSAVRKVLPQGGQSRADNSGYSSATAAAQPSSTAQNYNNYNHYSSGNAQAVGSDRINYQPYANNPTPAQSSSYQSFDNYNSRAANTAASTSTTLPSPGPQNVASSYPANSSTASNTAQWGTASSTPQTGTARAYNAAQSAAGTAAYNMPHSSRQSQSLQGFNVRPQSQTQARSSSSMYGSQQPQPQQHSQQQQQQSYSGYVSQQQPHTASSSSGSGSSGHQNNWYGFGATGTNPSSGGGGGGGSGSGSGNSTYSAGAASSAQTHGQHSHSGQSHQAARQHAPLNLSRQPQHGYGGGMDGDQALYDLLRTNPSG